MLFDVTCRFRRSPSIWHELKERYQTKDWRTDPLLLRLFFVALTTITAIPMMEYVLFVFIVLGILAGFAMFSMQLKHKQIAWQNPGFVLLSGFLVAYIVSMIVNFRFSIMENLFYLSLTFLFFMIMFGSPKSASHQETKQEVLILARVFVLLSFGLALASILMFVFHYSTWYMVESNQMLVGMAYGRLCGFYNPNTCGTIALLSAILSIYLLVACKEYSKIFLIGNIVMQTACLLLSDSRTAIVMGAFFLGACVWRWSTHWLATRVTLRRQTVTLLLTLVLAASSSYVALISYPIVRNNLYVVPQVVDSMRQKMKPVVESSPVADAPDWQSTDVNKTHRLDNGTSSRLLFWRSGIEVFRQNPLFGITQAGLYPSVAPKISGIRGEAIWAGGLHNMFVTIPVVSGIIGSVFLGGFALLFVWRILRYIFSKSISWSSTGFIIILFVVTLAGCELMESRVLFRANCFGVLFWSMVGYAWRWVEPALTRQKEFE